MNTRIAHKLIWWVLPLLALRGLVPAGFMIDTSQGGAAIIVCPGHVLQPQSAEINGLHDEGGSREKQKGAAVCPFAAATAVGPLARVPSVDSVVVQSFRYGVDDIRGPTLPFGPSRAQQSRAPPFFS